ncbi:MAG: hybrid sensor histidine kinase/response regulator [Gammaproteobacteria bacterium]|nr:hybrid sensor histidine kinase/response regulator [Gammaproteobacteria bacterium]
MTDQARKTILIVDDVPTNIQVLISVLRNEYNIVAATDGQKALSLAAKTPQPDLILLDVVMPEMSGYEVCAELKRNPQTKDIPVVFVSSLTDENDEETGLLAGGIDYLVKPVKSAIVRARVRNYLRLYDVQRELERNNQRLKESAALRDQVEVMTRHDLKSPLNVILAYPDILMLEGGLSDSQADALNEIRSAGYRMLNMINRSLDMYKLEMGKYRLNPEQVNLVGVLFSVLGEMQRYVREKKLTVNLLCRGKVITRNDEFKVYGEEMLCQIIFSNLLKNAMEASPEGGGVQVDLDLVGGRAHVRIHNQGVVPEVLRGCFFEKFSTAGKKGGTGLGTYSARLSALVQNGDISMVTDDVHGTELLVMLPVPG